jgi:hypothetical protein
MRDKRFVAEHRGGSLKKEQHYQLANWARVCAEHVLPYFGKFVDPRLVNALKVAEDWPKGKASVGDARKASVESHAVAREQTNQVAVAVARAIGQAVATVHMADHSLGGAYYGLKAVKSAGKSVEEERKWQNEKLPNDIKEVILSSRAQKNI